MVGRNTDVEIGDDTGVNAGRVRRGVVYSCSHARRAVSERQDWSTEVEA
jgi:hypothetical protein